MPAKINADDELILYGTVGDFFFEDGFTASEVVDLLAEHGRGNDITVRLNSGGGFVDDGKAIYNALASHRGVVTLYVDGVAASAASLLAMGADEIIMRRGATMMIHNPQAFAIGDKVTMERALDMLETEGEVMADIYAERSGKDLDEVKADMDAETWLTPAEAMEQGYCDKTEKGAKAISVAAFPYRLYEHAPTQMVALADRKGWKADKGKLMAKRNLKASQTPKPKPGDDDDDDGEDTVSPNPGEDTVNPNPEPGTSTDTLQAAAADIVDLCNAAKVPALASALIREGATVAQCQARIKAAGDIRKKVADARKLHPMIDPAMADQLIASGCSVEHAGNHILARLNDIQAANPTRSNFAPGQGAGQGGTGTGAVDPNDEAAAKALWKKQVDKANARFRPGEPVRA